MRIVTYNIRGCLGIDGVRSPERIARVLRETRADVVCLQEVHQRLPDSGLQDQPRRLSRLLGMPVRFQCNYRMGWGRYGNAILTSLPVLDRTSTELPNRRERESILRLPERRGLLELVLDTDDGPLTVMTSHWSLHAEDRLESVQIVAARVRQRKGRIVLCGDFNAPPSAPEMGLLAAETGLADAGAAENAPTFPSDRPQSRIDYVWGSPDLALSALTVMQTQASDHLPIVVTVQGMAQHT